ncbi:hypothetical protein D3C75_483140 [compost metagenome]
MGFQPFLGNRYELLIITKPALSEIFEGEIRLNPGRGPDHGSCAACWSLGNYGNIAHAVLADGFTNFRINPGDIAHKSALQIFLSIECLE